MIGVVPALQQRVLAMGFVKNNQLLHGLLAHPAGPFTIFFWAPTFKWAISLSNLADLQRPVEKISTAQQVAVTATGVIWSRYSMVITPVNWNLFSVNIFMAGTGFIQLYRKFTAPTSAPEAQS